MQYSAEAHAASRHSRGEPSDSPSLRATKEAGSICECSAATASSASPSGGVLCKGSLPWPWIIDSVPPSSFSVCWR